MKILPTQRVRMSENVLLREIDGESVLLNLDTETYFGLNETGTRMVDVLTASESIEKAGEDLLAEWDVDADRLFRDMEALILKLSENGLVHVDS